MKINPERLSFVLAAIGLRVEKNFLHYPDSDFTRYISSEYLASKRREEDEVYRMYEPTLVHHATGLRIVYTTTEGYFGDSVEYRVIDMFVLTLSGKKLDVVDVDFESEEFLTSAGNMPFVNVNKVAE